MPSKRQRKINKKRQIKTKRQEQTVTLFKKEDQKIAEQQRKDKIKNFKYNERKLNEALLADDYPVNWDYLYVVDGKVVRSDVKGNVSTLKRDLNAQGITCRSISQCDIAGRRKQLREAGLIK